MEKKQNQEIGPRLLPLSFCFLMLALSGILFGIYTFRQISWLKTQIHLQQKVIGTLQSGNGAQRVEEVSNYLFNVRIIYLKRILFLTAISCSKECFFLFLSHKFLQASSNPGSETAPVQRNAQEVCSCNG